MENCENCLACSSVCVQYNTRKRKSKRKRGRPGLIHHMNDVRWTQGGHREEGPIVKYVRIKLKSEFLTREDE